MKSGWIRGSDERCTGGTMVGHGGWQQEVVGRVLKNR